MFLKRRLLYTVDADCGSLIANTGYRKGISRKLGSGKPAAFFLHIPTSRGGRSAPPPEFSASYIPRKISDLEAPIYRAPLYGGFRIGRSRKPY